MTLSSAIDECLKTRWPADPKPTHYAGTKRWLYDFAPTLGAECDLSSLTFNAAIQAVQKYVDRMKADGYAPQSIVNAQRIISRFFSWLMKYRRDSIQWTANPASKKFLELAAVQKNVRAPVSQDELIILLREAQKTPVWPAVLLCVTAGMRSIGTLRLRKVDFNFETQTLRVFEKNRERLIPLNSWVCDELRTWCQTKSDEDKILNCSKNTLHNCVQRIRTKFALRPEVTLQGCRRTFISICMDAGVPAELVAKIAGNSVAVIEKHYKDLRTMKAGHVVKHLDFSSILSKNHSKETDDDFANPSQ